MTTVDLRNELIELRSRIADLEGKRRRARGYHVILAVALVAMTATVTRYVIAGASSSLPQVVPYRGVLKQNGVPVPNGTKQMAFSLYDQATGGNQIWGPETKSVAVAGGVFNVALGDAVALTDAQVQSATLWLDIQIEGQPLTPRQSLLTTPYARQAGFALRGAPGRDFVVDGNLGVGKAATASRVDVSGALQADTLNIVGAAQAGYLTVTPQSQPDQGGTIKLAGAPTRNDWTIDNFAGTFRLNHDGTAWLSLSSNGNLTTVGVIQGQGGRADCGAPRMEFANCRNGYAGAVFTACDFRVCNGCGCDVWNPAASAPMGGRQIVLTTPGF